MTAQTIYKAKPSIRQKPGHYFGYKMLAKAIAHFFRYLAIASVRNVPSKELDWRIIDFCEALLSASHTTVVVTGKSNLKEGQSYIFMSNHQSLMDIPVLLAALPPPIRMVSKIEHFKTPVLGRIMKQTGFIPLDRKNLATSIKQLELAKEKLRGGTSVWIAPEGSRSRDEFLKPFKKGGFHIAIELGVPIVPIWVDGAGAVMGADTIAATPNLTVTVHLGKPIQTAGMTRKDLEPLMEIVREEMLRLAEKKSTE